MTPWVRTRPTVTVLPEVGEAIRAFADADLMGASCFEIDIEQRCTGKTFSHFQVRDR